MSQLGLTPCDTEELPFTKYINSTFLLVQQRPTVYKNYDDDHAHAKNFLVLTHAMPAITFCNKTH
jgi:hypothetical protein